MSISTKLPSGAGSPKNEISPSTLWPAIRRIPTGVAVAGTIVDGAPIGMVVGTFSFISMAPPLVGFFGDHRSKTLEALLKGTHWSFSILAQDDRATADVFRLPAEERFNHLRWSVSEYGTPVLANALMTFHTVKESITAVGDHELVVGKILDYSLGTKRSHRPMVFFEGCLTRIDPAPLIAHDHWELNWDD